MLALAIFCVASAVFFLPQVQGKKMYQNDIIQNKSAAKEIKTYKEQTGKKALWTNSMFGGMPTYQISLPRDSNMISYVHKFFSTVVGAPISMILIGMLSFYVLGRVLELELWTSIIFSIAFALMTYLMTLIEAGHNTKVIAVYLIPTIVAGIILAFNGKWIRGSILFAFGLGYNLFINHPQMTYYFGLTLLILGAILVFKYLKAGNI